MKSWKFLRVEFSLFSAFYHQTLNLHLKAFSVSWGCWCSCKTSSHISHQPALVSWACDKNSSRIQLSWWVTWILGEKEQGGQDEAIPWEHWSVKKRLNLALILEIVVLNKCLIMITQWSPEAGAMPPHSDLQPSLLPLLGRESSRSLG